MKPKREKNKLIIKPFKIKNKRARNKNLLAVPACGKQFN